jgi:hypothetical protein
MIKLTSDNNQFTIEPVAPFNSANSPVGTVYTPEGPKKIPIALPPADSPVGPVYTPEGTYKIPITLEIEPGKTYYTKEDIVAKMNASLAKNPLTAMSKVDISGSHTVFQLTVNQVFTTRDYSLVFYDTTGFTHCNFGLPINVTPQSTLGWTLGFRTAPAYPLTPANQSTNRLSKLSYFGEFTNQAYTYDTSTDVATLQADTAINVNVYNYALLVLDDYTQNHLNDGLVTIATTNQDIPLPSYASRQSVMCNPQTKVQSIGGGTQDNVTNNRLTANQIYAANQILANLNNKTNGMQAPAAPSVQDIFALIPIKTQGMQPGQSYIEFGGTLQNQDRLYFGPVNIRRMSVQLLNDKGTLLDLNGQNWSFSLLVEQMYTA